MTTLQIEYPEELLHDAKQSKQRLEHLAREALFVRLYDLGSVSSGWAARALGISRREFLDLLQTYNVSYFDETTDVAAEANLAFEASRFQHQPTD